jgi:DNA-binding MarR family transcriptional regulator
MSREPTERRRALLQELGAEIRANQRATDMVDETVCRLLGLNRTDARALDVLDERGRMSAGELAAATRLTTGAITSVVDRLERAGYVHRVPDPADRRRVLIDPAPEMYEATRELMYVLEELGAPIMERYTDEQLELILGVTRSSRELQERHADWLRQKLSEGWEPPPVRDRGRQPPETRTEPA